MNGVEVVVGTFAASALGALLGFFAGLVPGLHMNNIAAIVTAYSAVFLSALGHVVAASGTDEAGLLACCFVASAMIAHITSEAVPSTFVGIPAEDNVSVLPAHRLAKAGLGPAAVRSAADGAIVGVLASSVAILPLCYLMVPPVDLYGRLSSVMGIIVVAFSALLVLSECGPVSVFTFRRRLWWLAPLGALVVFLSAGLLGTVVLKTGFSSSQVMDFPWMAGRLVSRSDLLLPLFAGLFGVPGLLLSLGSRLPFTSGACDEEDHLPAISAKELLRSLAGGSIVGWLPGMTSGSSATVLSPAFRDEGSADDVDGSMRYIWLYSAISASGAVLSLGALFAISRARSGAMDAVRFFLDEQTIDAGWSGALAQMMPLLLAMVASAAVSYGLIVLLSPRLSAAARFLCSDRVAYASMAFVCALSVCLTGSRGALVLCAASALGLAAPLFGVRRIQLMGSLLVPIAISHFT